MLANSLLMVHVCGGVIGVISGALSLVVPKGSGLHRVAGAFFILSMLVLASAGAIISAFFRPNHADAIGGVIAFYLIGTAWMAARRRERRTGAFDVIALLLMLGVLVFEVIFGVQAATSPTHMKWGYPPGPYAFTATMALLFIASDVRMILRGGFDGGRRIARHLWRMCFAFFYAGFTFFPGQGLKLFTRAALRTPLYYTPHIALLLAMIYWLVRVRRSKSYQATLQRREHGARPIAHAELAEDH